MKKMLLPILLAFTLPLSFSCNTLKNYVLTEQDAAAAVRQLLQLGTNGNFQSAFTKDAVMAAVFPESIRKTLNTLNQLGLTKEVDRFTTTLATAAEQSATRSVPVFVNAIAGMRISDAIRLVKGGGTSATDYLRLVAGTELRTALVPVMKQALDEYKLTEQWDGIIKPAKALVGDKLNLDLPTIMAGIVSEKMFQEMEEKEKEVRKNAAARTTPLLKRVFGGSWN